MLSCKMGRHQILGLLCFLFFLHSSLPFASSLCPPDQRDVLLHFKNSLVLHESPYVRNGGWFHFVCGVDVAGYTSDSEIHEWNEDTDCCSWDGVTCNNVTGNVIGLDLPRSALRGYFHSNSSLLLPKLRVLRLSSCNLTKFPYFLNSLKKITNLDLSSYRISGEIPGWFWGIGHDTLKHLDISDNLLEGAIPQLHWKRPSYIDLQKNSFQGPLPIPSPSTSYFYANDNGFTGEILSSICRLSSLLILDLSNNNLSRNMPPCFDNITKLSTLALSNNSLSGNIPPCFGNITNLVLLNLSSNKLQGPLPHSLVKCVCFSLDLSHNKFSDIFPANIFSNTSLKVIDLSNNKFGGPIPLPSPDTMYYSIASNNITGKIPSLICNATMLEMINLSNNSLTGSLPRCSTNFSPFLSVLNLQMNNLEGTIPRSFCLRSNLPTLDLSRNRFEGTLPRSLVKCKYLEVLDLSDNRIEDTFPRWLGTLQELKVLILRSNNFKDLLNIPREAWVFPKLRILDLSNNNFVGPLPANLMMNLKGMMNGQNGQAKSLYMTQDLRSGSYENSVTVIMKGQKIELKKILTIFTTIDLSHNSFQGDIPGVIGHLHSLIGLNLSHNHLTGSIPLTLGNLTDLGWLDLSSNKLNGGIPTTLGDLASLGYLNLSKNQLTGRIPQDKQLSTFSSDSFSGNPGLCGTPLPKACPGDAQPPPSSSSSSFDRRRHESWFKHETVWIGYASGVVIGMSTAYIAFEMGRPLWLARGVRMLERRAAKWIGRPKRKAIRFHGQ
ncbi:receptor-like protein 43 [Syzygium oleosum]|uniref:receptor-like protein 43 n=1 Tax=Syzygium oleosum TaxID=219896 RepID=UPI0024BB225C|nr:receptor-like protein 43 [Syzygium oleosum]